MFLALTITALALGACGYFGRRAEPYRPPALAEAPAPDTGRELYMRDCAWCHGSRGEGTTRAPDLVSGTDGPASVDFMLTTGRMPIEDPTDPALRGDPIYSPEEVAKIVAFIETFDPPGPEVPDVDPQDGDLALGGELYQENCAACHATSGIGAALTTGRTGETQGAVARRSGVLAPSVLDSTPRQIAEAMAVGPGTMPVFGGRTFSEEEVDSIVRYVLYLQDPDDRGGLPIGRTGPVAEGAIGWIVGFGVLVLFVRWIGTRVGEEE